MSGQQYDVTGVAGHYYSFIRDYDMTVNAQFDTAYTTGIYIDKSKKWWQMRPTGTWLSSLGITHIDEPTTASGVSTIAIEIISSVQTDAHTATGTGLNFGTVRVNGEAIQSQGTVYVQVCFASTLAPFRNTSRIRIYMNTFMLPHLNTVPCLPCVGGSHSNHSTHE